MKVSSVCIYCHKDSSICIYLRPGREGFKVYTNSLIPAHNYGDYPCGCLISKAINKGKLYGSTKTPSNKTVL